MNLGFFAYAGLTNAITCLMLGSYVLIRNFRSPLGRSFFFFMFSIAYWCTNYFIWLSSTRMETALLFMRNARRAPPQPYVSLSGRKSEERENLGEQILLTSKGLRVEMNFFLVNHLVSLLLPADGWQTQIADENGEGNMV